MPLRLPFFAIGPALPRLGAPKPRARLMQDQTLQATGVIGEPRVTFQQLQTLVARPSTSVTMLQAQTLMAMGKPAGALLQQRQTLVATGSAPSNVWPNGYRYQHEIRLAQWAAAGGSAANFLLPFAELQPYFRTVANGGEVESSAGWDIRFELSTGLKLAHVNLGFDGVNGLLASVVNLPRDFATAQSLFCYTGKAGLVASEEDPTGVRAGGWEFITAGADTIAGDDMTGQGRDLITSGGPVSSGLVGKFPAVMFDGINDHFAEAVASLWLNGKAAVSLIASYAPTFQNESRELVNVAATNTELSLRFGPTNRRLVAGARFGASTFMLESANDTAPSYTASPPPTQAAAVTFKAGEAPKLIVDGRKNSLSVAPGIIAASSLTQVTDKLEWGRGGRGGGVPTTPANWPYPQSLDFVRLAFPNPLYRYMDESDQLPMSEDSSGRLMVVGADGTGWAPIGDTNGGNSIKTEWRVVRVTGTPPDGLDGTDLAMSHVNGAQSKPVGVLAIDSDKIAVWYQWTGTLANKAGRTHCAISTDSGSTVDLNDELAAYLFRTTNTDSDVGNTNPLVVWGVLQLGAGYAAAGGIDADYVYCYLGTARQVGYNSFNASRLNRTMYMARVRIRGTGGAVGNLADRTKYQLFTGLNASGVPTWGAAGDFAAAKVRVYFDNNGMGLFFQVGWHAAIGKFVATYIHCGGALQTQQGIAVAIADVPWDQNAWQMIGYGRLLDQDEPDERDLGGVYGSVCAPSRWNDGDTMHFGLSTYCYQDDGVTGKGTPGDNLIVTAVDLVAAGGGTSIGYYKGSAGLLALRSQGLTDAEAESMTAALVDARTVYGIGAANTVEVANRGPVAQPVKASAFAGQAKIINVAGAGYDQNSDALTVVSAAVVSGQGTAAVSGSNSISFTGNSGLVQGAAVEFVLRDGGGKETVGRCYIDVTIGGSAGYACANPSPGKIRSSPLDKRLVILMEPISDSHMAAFRRIPNLITYSAYLRGADVRAYSLGATKHFEHDDAGLDRMAHGCFDRLVDQRRVMPGCKSLLTDYEGKSFSTGLPANLAYQEGKPGSVTKWDTANTDEWNLEVLRFHREVARRTTERCVAAGILGVEHTVYNIPENVNFANKSIQSRYNAQAAAVNASTLCPTYSHAGPSSYFSFTPGNIPEGTASEMADTVIAWRKEAYQRWRTAIPRPQKLIPAIWPRWFCAPHPLDKTLVPPGKMGKMAQAMLDAGADGFFLWTPSDSPSFGQAFVDRHNEIVDVIIADGRFVSAM